MKFKFTLIVLITVCWFALNASAQTAWYIDGYHGGVWGHYPDWNTRFMADMLKKNPDWKINIELEPETWDRVQVVDPAAYADFKALFADQSLAGRIEYVNPAYAQSYNYNISGESIIRQFGYGIKKIRAHFPEAVFTSYSSEEPCFTSALPQILTSFGFKYASLKNPNTCFGGYTRAHGSGLVNWIGPDGTGIITSPRYAVERLSSKSTWQTIAWDNSANYIKAAYDNSVKHPIGMTLQDAGWKGGPFIGNGEKNGIKSTYTTWRNYFANVAKDDPHPDWKVSQEDMLVNLVWGSQVTQRIAQRVRATENKIIQSEKLASMAKVYAGSTYPQADFDAAWRTLLLSQHHDCWIVPYNGKPGNTWADKVNNWTTFTDNKSDSIIRAAGTLLSKNDEDYITVYNTTGINRTEVVYTNLPSKFSTKNIGVFDSDGRPVASQLTAAHDSTPAKIAFKAVAPSMGYAFYQLKEANKPGISGAHVKLLANGNYQLDTDLYSIIIDPAHGGIIKSIIARKLGDKEFVDKNNARSFNELRGNFYNDGGFKSTKDNSAKVDIVENGPISVKVAIRGTINGTNCTQFITLSQGEPRIDIHLNINWKENVGIGEGTKPDTYKWELPAKPFYDDRNKLLTMFPLNLKHQKVYKNAPFDVTESKLDNTFYTRWDSIKNNVIHTWVDVTGDNEKYGMALLTDHTTSYAHGKDFPLALNIQYSGMGLWGKNYTIQGPTEIHYALIPHSGKWDKAGIWADATKWNEPLIVSQGHPSVKSNSLISINDPDIEVTSVQFDQNDMLIRLFNAGVTREITTVLNFNADTAELVELEGRVKQVLQIDKQNNGMNALKFSIPRFGIRTIRLINARK
ncbi:glycoside hydrolase family 38 C-terminal domain-containing protein [Mucilaginibacter sabulilitoris]|uniref:Glycoside hydrolase family 38 C-terminal domain-containing protein n=1 Tax=Mucilaginibacter sabulilitoris TaxID=1173583 RepID=A0ABZ0TW58_9SPHI|nr:glycoside hydrolase family 38 C-terminal domain-containing protein [Mucilaginibacter sabulilitoris]WPU96383.1 glycoside hydrolase family 38 C-terminal domain-containing protein [Mucilaginibacter sabulilitoris]